MAPHRPGADAQLLREGTRHQTGAEVEAGDINAWFAHMRKTPASRGKVRRESIQRNPFDCVTFPKVGKPLIQTIDSDEFERLLLACAPPQETGPMAVRAAVRNRAILWVLPTRTQG